MNVRCPNCSAVFPAGGHLGAAGSGVECPVCLTRFDAAQQATMSLSDDAPRRAPAGPMLGQQVDDEFETFGGVLASGATTVVPSSAVPRRLDENSPSVAAGKPISDVHEIGFVGGPEGSGIDFDALLSDAVKAVDRRPGDGRTNPFGRISAPRSGATAVQDDIFAGAGRTTTRPSSPLLAAVAPAPVVEDVDSLFEAPGAALPPRPADEDELRVGVSPGRSEAPAMPSRRPQVSTRKARPAPGRRIAQGIGTLVLAGAAAGAGLDLAGYGFFGSKLWLAADETAARPGQTWTAGDLGEPVALLDTRSTYEAEVRRLDQLLAKQPRNGDARAALVERLLDLYERAPEAFASTPEYRKKLEAALQGQTPPARFAVLDMLAMGQTADALARIAALEAGDADDKELAVRLRLVAWRQQLRAHALNRPGLTADPEADPTRQTGAQDKDLQQARKLLDGLLVAGKRSPTAAKLAVLDGALRQAMGEHATAVQALQPVVAKAADHLEARLLLAAAQLEGGQLEQAEALAQEVLKQATEARQPAVERDAWLVLGRVAARRGDRDKLIKVLQAAVKAVPDDELATVRLGRLLTAEKRADDAQKLLVAGKKAAFKSVAFEVALVEYWLYANRNEDALAELVEATKMYPDSVDLLFLRGQVEDKEQHQATARDYFTQVLAREPKHLRAILRLGELQAAAGRHDEALAMLQRARKDLGDDEALLRLIAQELVELKRDAEAREVVAKLLVLQPDNRTFLLRAAQMDLRAGEVDRALGYLRQLRDRRQLDREAALQMAVALASKGQPGEAAQTLVPFAEQAETDIELNTLAGRYLVDSGDYDRATTHLQRAAAIANGKSAETLFQYGRLAFKREEVEHGISRIKQAIAVDGMAHEYRFELARSLFDRRDHKGARELAVTELQTVLASREAFAKANRPVPYLAELNRLLARSFTEQHRWDKAVPHLRAVLELEPTDADSLVQLGRALYQTGSTDAPATLKQVLRLRPGDGRAALFLGLAALNRGQTSEALRWLQQAAQSSAAELAEAHYHVALIHRERNQNTAALRAVEQYLRAAREDDPYRAEAEGLRRALAGK